MKICTASVIRLQWILKQSPQKESKSATVKGVTQIIQLQNINCIIHIYIIIITETNISRVGNYIKVVVCEVCFAWM